MAFLTDQDQIEIQQKVIEDEEIEKELVEFLTLKNNIMNYIGVDKFIDEIKKGIKSSKSFEFTSQISEKFIDEKKPVFNIKLKQEEYKKVTDSLYGNTLLEKTENFRDIVHSMVADEILGCTSELINKSLSNPDDEELTKLFKNLDKVKENVIVSTLFSTMASNIKENIIFLQMII